jgi:hypothetical protein
MSTRKKYVKRPDQAVAAVQLALDTEGFTYRKWGAMQRCKPGDWVVGNKDDVYTVDRETFERTYRQVGPGAWLKTTPVWAELAKEPGVVPTKEGETHYEAGTYLVFNEENGGDGYAVTPEKFEEMYEAAE